MVGVPKRKYTKKSKYWSKAKGAAAPFSTSYKRAHPIYGPVSFRKPITSRGPGTFGNIVRSIPSFQEGVLPFNTVSFNHFPYAEDFAISAPGTSGIATTFYTYRLNSIFDPRVELGGGQPIQADQVTPMFERYWVHKCDVIVSFSNPLYSGMMVGVRVRGMTNTVTTAGRTRDELREMDMVKYKMLNKEGEGFTKFKFTVKPREVLGLTKAQYVNLEYSAATTQNPVVGVHLEPFACHTVAGEDSTVRCYVKIIYYVQLTNKITKLDA